MSKSAEHPKQILRLRLEAKKKPVDGSIVVTVPDVAGETVTVQPANGAGGGVAVLFPDPNQPLTGTAFLFVAYATQSAPITVTMPNVADIVYAALPNGITSTVLDDISAAIQDQLSPPPPTVTKNG